MRRVREHTVYHEALLRRQGAIEAAVPGNTAGPFSGAARSKLLFSDAMKRAVSHPSMLAIVRQLIGAEEICLTGNYALRAKAPSEPMLAQGLPDGGTVPWHQDTCVSRRRHGSLLGFVAPSLPPGLL